MPDISEKDVSTKKTNIQKKPHCYLTKPHTIPRRFKGGRYAMTALCRLFRSDGWRYCRGSTYNPIEFVPAVLTINIFHGEHYWQGLVGYSIAMAKRFLNNTIYVVTVSSCWSQYVESCSSHPASYHPRTLISYAVLPFSWW